MDYDREIERLDRIAQWLDEWFRIPGTGIRIGADSIIGLVPGVGDAVPFAVSLYMIARAQRMGVPGRLLGRMAANSLIDFVIGSVPVLGDVFDVGFKANRRNVDLLKRHFGFPHR